MLVIRRREGEAILLDGGIEVVVVEISASRVKLGITAPVGIGVVRKEVQLSREQNVSASARPDEAELAAWAETLRAGAPGGE